jgi:hypothetical protein
LVAAIALAAGARAEGARTLQDPIGLPLGSSATGLSTSVSFYAPCRRGRLSGVVVDRMIPETTRIRIREQQAPGRVIYDGPVTVGQFIPFTTIWIVWTGWKSGYGNHMNGIWVRGVCQ